MRMITGIAAMFLVIELFAACASRLEMDYGNSFRLAKEQQILHPEAGDNLEPVTGLDGKAAVVVLEKARSDSGQASPEKPSVLLGEILK